MTTRERWMSAAIVILGLLVVWSFPGGGWTATQAVHAQVPDAGGQRLTMIEELRQLNKKLDKLQATLDSGITVKVSESDKK